MKGPTCRICNTIHYSTQPCAGGAQSGLSLVRDVVPASALERAKGLLGGKPPARPEIAVKAIPGGYWIDPGSFSDVVRSEIAAEEGCFLWLTEDGRAIVVGLDEARRRIRADYVKSYRAKKKAVVES